MFREHYTEKANFRALVQEDAIGYVEERLTIIDVFLRTEKHVTHDELMGLLRERGYYYESEFVQQCMNRWVEYGFAQKKEFEGQPLRYEHRHLGKHHDHLICTKCGKITEFQSEEMEGLQTEIAMQNGFHILQHKMEIYGLCNECMEVRRPLMPLTMVMPGEDIVIKEIRGGKAARSKLAHLGLRPGDNIQIVSNVRHGRLVVAHDNMRLAMGRGIADKIMVFLN